MSSGVRLPSKFAVNTLLPRNYPRKPLTDKDSCTELIQTYQRKGMPRYTSRRRDYKPVRWLERDEEVKIARRVVNDWRYSKHLTSLSL